MYKLLDTAWSWSEFITNYFKGKPDSDATVNLLTNTMDIISIVLWVILAIVGALGAIYAIYLGVQLARAEDQGKRDDAKKHLITVCIAIGVTIALIVIFNVAIPAICSAFIKDATGGTNPNPNPPGGTPSMLQPVLSVLKAFR